MTTLHAKVYAVSVVLALMAVPLRTAVGAGPIPFKSQRMAGRPDDPTGR